MIIITINMELELAAKFLNWFGGLDHSSFAYSGKIWAYFDNWIENYFGKRGKIDRQALRFIKFTFKDRDREAALLFKLRWGND